MAFKDDLLAERMGRGWTQEDMAKYLGIQRTHLSKLERGTRGPGIQALSLLARKLGKAWLHRVLGL